MADQLTPAERAAWARDGYFVRPDALPGATIDALVDRLSELITRCAREHQAGTRPTLAFWDILRGSRDDASVCWSEPNGPLPERPEDWEPLAMRVGHGIHRCDPLYRELSHGPAIGGLLKALIPEPALLVQSAVVYKQPRSSTVQFGLHQDAAYITTTPESLVLAFVALDDMDADNGGLCVVPGTHRDQLHVELGMSPAGFFPIAGKSPAEADYRPVLLPMRRGTIAFIHGRTLHGSGPNRAPTPRRALIVHAISGASRLSPTSWVQPPPEGFEPIERGSSSK